MVAENSIFALSTIFFLSKWRRKSTWWELLFFQLKSECHQYQQRKIILRIVENLMQDWIYAKDMESEKFDAYVTSRPTRPANFSVIGPVYALPIPLHPNLQHECKKMKWIGNLKLLVTDRYCWLRLPCKSNRIFEQNRFKFVKNFGLRRHRAKMSLSNWQIFTIWMQLGSIRTWSEYFWTWIQVKSLQNQTAFHFSSSPPPTMGEIVELLLECALQVADCSNNHLHKDSMQMELIGAIWYCIRYRKFTFQVYLNSKRPSLHRKVCVLWSGSSSTMNAIT